MKHSLIILFLLASAPLATPVFAHAPKDPAPEKQKLTNDWSRSVLTQLRVERTTDKARHGGVRHTKATLSALDWLVKHQQTEGQWSAHQLEKACAGQRRSKPCDAISEGAQWPSRHVEVGLTGLVLLSFAGRGNTYLEAEKPKYAPAIDRAVTWLLATQVKGTNEVTAGFFGSGDQVKAEDFAIYNHAIATLAICELLLGTGDQKRLGNAAQAGVEWCLRAQNPGFAWKYTYLSGRNSTPSTIWLSNAVLIGEECAKAGLIEIAPERFLASRKGTLAWLAAVTSSVSGIIGYEAPGDMGSQLNAYGDEYPFSKEHSTNSAGGLFYLALEGGTRAEAKAEESESATADANHRETMKSLVALLMRSPPSWETAVGKKKSKVNFYYWAFATQAMALTGTENWAEWRKTLEKEVVTHQLTTGCAKGSWDPIGEWGIVGGRVYSTAMAVLALESSYRYQLAPTPSAKK